MESDTVIYKIRDLPRETHQLMRDRAARNRRSLNQQIIVDLESAANIEKIRQQGESHDQG